MRRGGDALVAELSSLSVLQSVFYRQILARNGLGHRRRAIRNFYDRILTKDTSGQTTHSICFSIANLFVWSLRASMDRRSLAAGDRPRASSNFSSRIRFRSNAAHAGLALTAPRDSINEPWDVIWRSRSLQVAAVFAASANVKPGDCSGQYRQLSQALPAFACVLGQVIRRRR